MFSAVVRGDLELIKQLLLNGRAVESGTRPCHTPLHAAVCVGNFEAAKLLLDAGASPSRQDERGYTALSHAIWYQRPAFIELLLSAGPPKTLTDTAAVGTLEMVKALVAAGAGVNGERGQFFGPLYFALIREQVEIARYLIGERAIPSPHLSTLEAAARFGVATIIADELERDSSQSLNSAAFEAATGDHVTALELLLARGAFSQADIDGVFLRACCCDAISTIRLLVGLGADVNQGTGENTPLALAYAYSDVATIDELLRLGATPLEDG
jgi:ankyrin repeat protein